MDLDLRGTRLANFDEAFELFEEGKLHFTPGLSLWNWDEGTEGLGFFFTTTRMRQKFGDTCEMNCPTSLLKSPSYPSLLNDSRA